jgi:hypothetical protein
MAAALKIKSVIGFNGKVARSMHYTPCGKYLIYPLGSFLVIKNLVTDKEAFMDGHSNIISCATINRDGTKLASGQVSMPGIKVRLKSLCFAQSKCKYATVVRVGCVS